MPSQLHEAHLLLFRNHPALAADLVRGALGVKVPAYTEARVISGDLTDVQPAEYRADMVIEFRRKKPVYAMIVEVQLSRPKQKRYTWPAYVSVLRARLRCPVSLLVVTPYEAVARWASQNVQLGGMHHFTPYVLGPSGIPEVTDAARAADNPELAVLSAMAHGRDANTAHAIEIALAAQSASVALDADRAKIYLDLILNSLGEAARQALMTMDAQKYEYQSEFARKYVAVGLAEGRVALLQRLLTVRFGALDTSTLDRMQHATIDELDAIGERLLVARTLKEVLDAAAPPPRVVPT